VTDFGTYIKMSDKLPEHRKIVAAGGDAAWLHVCALAYASRNHSDGFIPANVVPRLSDRRQPARLAAKLVMVDLWHEPGHECKRCPQPAPGEYVIHDYLQHQRSAARIAEVSAARASAGSAGGRKSKPKPKQVASDSLDGCSDVAEANAKPSFTEGFTNVKPQAEAEADIQRPTVAAAPAATAARLSVTQRSKLITDAYAAVEPMCKWPAVNGIVIKAIKSERFTDDEIRDALLRMAAENRSVTVDSLRTELAGLPPRDRQKPVYQPYQNPTDQGAYDQPMFPPQEAP
jgi:hypothetical protein